MAYNLVRLGKLLSDENYLNLAEKTLNAFSNLISSYPAAHIFSLVALDLLVNGSFELIAVGDKSRAVEEVNRLQQEFLPEGVYGFKDETLEELSPFVKSLPTPSEGVYYYLCKNYSCEEPTDSIETVRELLT